MKYLVHMEGVKKFDHNNFELAPNDWVRLSRGNLYMDEYTFEPVLDIVGSGVVAQVISAPKVGEPFVLHRYKTTQVVKISPRNAFTMHNNKRYRRFKGFNVFYRKIAC